MSIVTEGFDRIVSAMPSNFLEVQQLLYAYPAIWGSLALAIIVIFGVWLYDRPMQKKHITPLGKLETGTMLEWPHKRRTLELQRFLADGICDLIEDGVTSGKLTDKEARMAYRHLAHALSMPDLLPVPRKKKQEYRLKQRIRRGRTVNGAMHNITPTIPGDPPTQEIKTKKTSPFTIASAIHGTQGAQ